MVQSIKEYDHLSPDSDPAVLAGLTKSEIDQLSEDMAFMSYKERLEHGIKLCCQGFERYVMFDEGKFYTRICIDDFFIHVYETKDEDDDVFWECKILSDDETQGPLRMRFCPFCGTKLPLMNRSS